MSSSASLRQQAYEYIHRRIVSGHLPGGAQVSEQSLAKEIGISRTPVREAIRQLAIEGLVEQVPRYGTIVRVPDRQEVAELYEVREALEGFAAAKAATDIAPDDLEVLKRLCGRMKRIAAELRASGREGLEESALRDFLATDMAFHLVLIRAAGNRRIMKITADTHVMTRIFGFRRQAHDLGIVARAYRYHRRILEALEEKNLRAARTWMSRHIRRSKRQALESLDRQKAGQAEPLALPEEVQEELNRIERSLGTQSAE